MRLAQQTDRLVGLLAILFLSSAGCGPSRNPVLQLPATPVPLYLSGQVVTDSGTPIWARLAVIRVSQNGVADTIRDLTVGSDGRFRLDNLGPGAYVLDTRSIGYHRRKDTLLLSASPGLGIVLEMRRHSMCLDLCPPDSLLVQAARAQQSKWQCDREKASIESIRARWAEFLADSSVKTYFHHQLDASQISAQLRNVRDDGMCRRLAIASFPAATSLAFTLFRWSRHWLLSDTHFGEAVIVNDSLRQVAGVYGGGFAVWLADRRVP